MDILVSPGSEGGPVPIFGQRNFMNPLYAQRTKPPIHFGGPAYLGAS